ncbi:hypothetical protein [Leptolinea tardivitalis]|uniref:Glycosyltransferase RgtA/B/C/D-like domain-containing protein n=1 Tax=Leptolinea tardivitalis TaxID=229920 RepID=A0A0P6WUC1_9CHLR|nr:hypothetical protein [Leptolinea tardivitalis]KPL70248.1 hypothetical protein ADM99_13810 [Leptolinea tardivitalis]GAP21796.1 hypothetical protein LTAR_02012 [Leptolinea tardivitalis]
MKQNQLLKFALISILAGVLFGILVALVSPGPFINSFWGSALIAACSVFGLLSAWKWAGSTRTLAWIMSLAYLLRMLVGIGMYTLLPTFGYDEPTQNAGYVFYDAAQRDRQSWELSQAHQVMEAATGKEYVTDQYGGLLAFSAAVYSVFSSDAHRPLFIVLFTAFAGSIGIPFLFLALRKRFGDAPALLSAWIFALYPSSILLGASQMREPFILGLAAIAFWAAAMWKSADRKNVIAVLIVSLGAMAWFSSRVALPIIGVLAVWFWLEHYVDALPEKWQKISWVILIGAALVFAVYGWRWVASTSVFDTRMTEYNSGRIQKAIEELGVDLRIPFIVGYGLTQPVLPAALTDPALPIWRVTSSLLAAGWYALAPFIVYALIALWREKDPIRRRLLAWSTLACVVWVVISSARAGGDQWDNPRYRTIFLPWLALIAAWGWNFARRNKDAWLGRILVVEGIFLVFFISWYLSRYYNLLSRMPFNTMLLVIILLSLGVLIGGAVWDWVKRKQKA